MRRRLLNLLTLLSLLLCAGLMVLWVVSFYRVTRVMRVGSGSSAACFVFHGVMKVQASSGLAAGASQPVAVGSSAKWIWEFQPPDFPRVGGWRALLLPDVSVVSVHGGRIRHRIMFLPLWIPAVAAAVPPALWLRGLLSRRRPRVLHPCPA